MDLPRIGEVNAFAIIVDINQFTELVRGASDAPDGSLIAQFVGDVLSGSVAAIESVGGEVVGLMGDAVLGVIAGVEDFMQAVCAIATDLDKQCEWISSQQSGNPNCWAFARGGPSLKILVEYGELTISSFCSRALGDQRLVIGQAVNHAARIGGKKGGNRCHLGPVAADLVKAAGYRVEGPYRINGKDHEVDYVYYELDLGDLWRAGDLRSGEDTFWG